tara:strand:+ start:5809 stop:6042 length:234 start_codon:yes stop_codon:yes gene_type:complete
MKDKIIQLAAEKSAMPIEWINENTRIEDLDVDSLEFVELIFEIEEEFNISVPVEIDDTLKTIGDFINVVNTAGPRGD